MAHLQLRVAHVNHGARASAWQDECVALQLGARLGVAGRHRRARAGRARDEARLRDARYRRAGRCARAGRAQRRSRRRTMPKIKARRVLLALLRGTGPQGLARNAGAPAARDGHRSRAAAACASRRRRCVAYCHARALPYAVDPDQRRCGLPAQRGSRSARRLCARSFPHSIERSRAPPKWSHDERERSAARRAAATRCASALADE